MKVIVSGGGIAGLSAAKALTRLPFIDSVKIIDNAANDRRLIDNTYTGLWNPSLCILSKYGVDIERNICYVKKSGYRSTDGRWLAQPRKGLGIDYRKGPCLGFIKDKDLLTALISSLPSSVSFINESISIVEISNKVVAAVSNTGNIYEADLIIAADGKNSAIRKCLHTDNTLKYRGYEVYRGHSTSLFHFAYKQRITEMAFQTWGPGLRFATVPTYEGNAWFLAINKTSPNANTIKGAHSVINKEKFEDLVAMVSNWHNPIPELLANTDNGHKGVIVCDAYGGSSTKHPQSVLSNNTGVAFVGDASYCLDPILAQGTGLAIEHSYLLAKALEQHKNTNDLGKALKYFDEIKEERQSRLHYLSDISQSIGSLHDKNTIQIRDNIMAFLYENYKDTIGTCFDKIIQFSSSNRFL